MFKRAYCERSCISFQNTILLLEKVAEAFTVMEIRSFKHKPFMGRGCGGVAYMRYFTVIAQSYMGGEGEERAILNALRPHHSYYNMKTVHNGMPYRKKSDNPTAPTADEEPPEPASVTVNC